MTDIVLNIRDQFPILHQKVHDHPLIYFDNAATSQKPLKVINAISEYYQQENSNCLLYTSPSPRDRSLSRMPSSA